MEFLCLAFANSRWYITHKPFSDPLYEQAWLARLARRWALPEITPETPGFDRLPAFRERVFRALLTLSEGRTIGEEDMAPFNQILSQGAPGKKLIWRDGQYHLQTLPRADAVQWLRYEITLSLARLITEVPLSNLRKCANPDCDWIFYDSSKSHTRKWCDNRCASLMKVRKHRAGRAAGPSDRADPL